MDRLYEFLLLAQTPNAQPGGGGVPGAGAEGGAPPGAPTGGGGGGYEPIIFLVLMLVVFYFFLIRPQQKRAKKHKELVESLKRGDTVITSSGVYGRIVNIDGNTVTLEIAKNTRIKILRSFVGGRADEETEKQLSNNPQQ